MWIGLGQKARALRRGVLAPHLGKAQEEALVSGKPIFYAGRFGIVSDSFAHGHKRHSQSAIVRCIFTKCETTVEMHIVDRDKGAVFVRDTSCPLFELSLIGITPPVGKVALR